MRLLPPTDQFLRLQQRVLPPVCIAMSGGVDSAVAALLLLKAGHPLRAIFIKSWADQAEEDSEQSTLKTACQWRRDWADVQAVCRQLDIPCKLMDLSRDYWNKVWEPCLRIWQAGGTPNPDVMCNRRIKLGLLAERVLRSDPQTLLATGHYARLTHTNGCTRLYQATDKSKDQSYYLSTTPISALRRTLFPLGAQNLSKLQVRQIAREHGLVNARKPESMGICLVEPTVKRFGDFLATQIEDRPGKIVSLEAPHECLGSHRGLWHYTIGQHCPLTSASFRRRQSNKKFYVAQKDPRTNEILVVPDHDHPLLWTKIVCTHDFVWLTDPPSLAVLKQGGTITLSARLRTGTLDPIPCTVSSLRGRQAIDFALRELRIELEWPEHGVATGQVVVLMSETKEEVLGGGTID